MADWERVGNEFTFAPPRDFMLFFEGTNISDSSFAFADASHNLISELTFDGANWSEGTRYSIPSVNTPPGLCKMTDTLVAYSTAQFNRVYALNRSGGAYSTGPLFTVSHNRGSLARLSDDTVAFGSVPSGSKELRKLLYNGSSWSQVGARLVIPGGSSSDYVNIATIGENLIAWIDTGNKTLRTYEFDGANWSLVGNIKSAFPSGNNFYMTRVRDNIVAIVFTGTVPPTIQAYEWDGTDWLELGDPGLIEATTGNTIVPIQLTDTLYGIVAHESGPGLTSNLKAYRFNALPALGPPDNWWERLQVNVTQGAS